MVKHLSPVLAQSGRLSAQSQDALCLARVISVGNGSSWHCLLVLLCTVVAGVPQGRGQGHSSVPFQVLQPRAHPHATVNLAPSWLEKIPQQGFLWLSPQLSSPQSAEPAPAEPAVHTDSGQESLCREKPKMGDFSVFRVMGTQLKPSISEG